MKRIVVVLLALPLSLILTAASGDATAQTANAIAIVVVGLSPLVLKLARAQWPNLDGRIFAIGTFIVAVIITAVAFGVSGEWRGLDWSNVATFMTWAGLLYGIQQGVYNLFKPQLQTTG